MAEVKAHNEDASVWARYSVRGGKRETNYDDLKSCIKRVKALSKQGMVIGRIRRWNDGTYEILMMEPEKAEPTTPGYQAIRYGRTGDGRVFVYNTIQGYSPYIQLR